MNGSPSCGVLETSVWASGVLPLLSATGASPGETAVVLEVYQLRSSPHRCTLHAAPTNRPAALHAHPPAPSTVP